jgi:hypothetical protein
MDRHGFAALVRCEERFLANDIVRRFSGIRLFAPGLFPLGFLLLDGIEFLVSRSEDRFRNGGFREFSDNRVRSARIAVAPGPNRGAKETTASNSKNSPYSVARR